MNFKGFLKKTGFLNEDGGDETAKVSFIRNAYRKSYPNSDATALNRKPEELWNAVLKKASYKLTKNSKEGTKKAVQFAKGAKTQGTKRFQLTDTYEKTEKDTMRANLLGHLEDWDEKDFQDLKQALPNNSFITRAKNLEELKSQISQMRDANDLSADLQKSSDELFGEIKKLETVEEKEKEWKDKTFDDPESISQEDFDKLDKEKLKEILGDKLGDKELSYENLKDILKNGDLDDTKIGELDKLIPEPEKTPETQDPPATPNGSEPPPTENRDKQAQMQEMEKKRRLEKKLKDNDIPVKEDGTPDFDNPKTLEKINELMINGDDELYNQYVLAKGGTQSDLAKMITDRQAKENELAKTDLENRMARHEAEKDQQKAICNVALALDIFLAFFSGKVQDGFTTLANKRVQAAALSKQFDEGLNKDAFDKENEKIENAHKTELDSITNWEKQRLAEIEQDRQTPMGTQAYKRKYQELIKEKENKKQDFKKRKDAYMPKVDRKEKIDKFLFTLDTSTPIDTNNPVLKELIPQKEGESLEDYTARLQEETKDAVKLKEKLQAESDEIQQVVENFNNEEKTIESDFNKAAKDLESDPDVQAEFKDANAAYEFKKANIQAEMNVLRAKEQKRYEDRKSVNKQVFEERRRVLKNIATMGQWSSDPDSVFATEMQAFNKRAKSLYESRGIPWNEDNDPLMSDDPDVLRQAMADYKESLKQKGQQQEQEEKGKGKGKKGDETGGKKPLGGKTGETDPEKKNAKPGKGQKQLTQLQNKFKNAKLMQSRFDEFLANNYSDLDTEDPDDDEELQKAIKEFNQQKFPETDKLSGQTLRDLGVAKVPEGVKDASGNPITDLDAYATYLKDNKNAEALKNLKKDLGFDDDSTGVTNKTPLKIKDLATKGFDEIKGYLPDNPTLKIDGTEVALSAQNWDTYKNKPEVTEYLDKNPEVLKKMSNGKTENEKEVIDKLPDGEKDNSNKLSDRSLKSLWKMLNSKGISIRALPGYDSGWTDEEKKNAIKEYLLKNKSFFGLGDLITESINLKHRKTAFKRLNEMSQAQKRASDRRTLRKFSELLVKDFRDFT